MISLPIGMKSEALPAKTGRPGAFDPDAALERAMHVFWAKGYEGASLSDLTGAMRINRPSLYPAFGNKEELFRKVLDRYAEGPFAYFEKALAANSLKKSGRRLILNSHKACSPVRRRKSGGSAVAH